ncbi:nitrilase/cyanide hydratase and apolipo protein N-acyltransferase [Zopfia rhizophila CBS 207.26]|uniref:Nitrilase/cyanide hydratase and apolipo protein N-acyltransferase n=1 Tax=Zopfia rhizophila CBS 207.26 TaxID=1314779 RepID=A0A6A6D728_9PEZI|nr:nitrilase/cyanide hydratase and apolipo protein N-acyltransferase [Zopfia rhizophila CBS 207.26]
MAVEHASLGSHRTLKLAAVEAAPVFLNKAATTEKVCSLIREAGEVGADVIGFPEAFIPGYPGWSEVLPMSTEPAASLFVKLFEEAVEIPGPELQAIQEACKAANIYAVVGINERRPNTTGTLYNTQLIISRDGTLLHKHQKYVPTVSERIIHAPGNTGSKASARTDFGCLSSLICGENGNPLAQYSLSLDYPTVHVASWPSHFCPGQELRHAIQVASCGFANSLCCFVINSVAVVADDAIEAYGINQELREYLQNEKTKRRATIIGPGGFTAAGPLEQPAEGILYADVNFKNIIMSKYIIDYAGHYNRPELFAHHFKKYDNFTEL